MKSRRLVATVTVVVRDYDEAIAWFREKLGFLLVDDAHLGGGKRWVVMTPSTTTGGARILLAKADSADQAARIGDQTGGRVFLFLETDSFGRDYADMLAAGVTFREAPRSEAYGTVAVFEDLCGNLWDLIEPKR